MYYVVSGLFFAASAYAQLNDPDPFFWVAGYLIAGCGMQLLPALSLGFNHYLTSAGTLCRLMARSISIVNAVILAMFVYDVIPMLDYSKRSFGEVGWNFLELEEGREIVGLLLLLLHGLFVQSQQFYSRDDDDDKATTATVQQQQPTMMGGLAQTMSLLVAFSLLGTALYLWVYYQPAMVAKYQTAHCAGQFHDPLLPGIAGDSSFTSAAVTPPGDNSGSTEL
jgi:hypothetical protein